jgi:hypothetical protein
MPLFAGNFRPESLVRRFSSEAFAPELIAHTLCHVPGAMSVVWQKSRRRMPTVLGQLITIRGAPLAVPLGSMSMSRFPDGRE